MDFTGLKTDFGVEDVLRFAGDFAGVSALRVSIVHSPVVENFEKSRCKRAVSRSSL